MDLKLTVMSARNSSCHKHIMDIHQDKLETQKIKQKTVIPAKTDISAKTNIDAQFFKKTFKGFECLKCPAKRNLKSGKAAMKQHVKEKHLNSNEKTNDLTINDSSNKENKMEEGNDSTVVSASDKGQLISECLFDVLSFPKNQRKI